MGIGESATVTGLEILDDPCAGCGACCEYVGVPPGFVFGYSVEEVTPEAWWQSDDGRTLLAMPAEIRDTLDAYFRGVREGVLEDREVRAKPCLWYDAATRRCSHYEWRPSACREFAAGSDDCLGIREYAGR